MNKNTIWQIAVAGIIAAALLFGVSSIVPRSKTPPESAQPASQTETASITIEGLYADKKIQFFPPQTVLGVLRQLNAKDKEVRLVTKAYPGLGVLVESIGRNANGTNDEYWQYKVNGVMPQVGADKLEIKNGDVIEWYFGASAW